MEPEANQKYAFAELYSYFRFFFFFSKMQVPEVCYNLNYQHENNGRTRCIS